MKLYHIIFIIFIKKCFSLNCLSCNQTYFSFRICINDNLSFNNSICVLIDNEIKINKLISANDDFNVISYNSSKLNSTNISKIRYNDNISSEISSSPSSSNPSSYSPSSSNPSSYIPSSYSPTSYSPSSSIPSSYSPSSSNPSSYSPSSSIYEDIPSSYSPSSSIHEDIPSSYSPSSSIYDDSLSISSPSDYNLNTNKSNNKNYNSSSTYISDRSPSSYIQNTSPSIPKKKLDNFNIINLIVLLCISVIIIILIRKFVVYKKNKYLNNQISPIINPKNVKVHIINIKRPKDYMLEFFKS